jgi:ribosome-associated protein
MAAPAPETRVAIRDEYVTLAQLLKMAGVIGTGGEAKHYLADTAVIVNGEPEQRRGRKLRPGDLIVAPGAAPIRLTAEAEPAEPSDE